MKEFFTKKCEKAFSPVPNWVQRLATITMGAKLTYGRLLQCANDEGVAWPSQRYLAGELGCSLRSIVNYIGELKKHDLIQMAQIVVGDRPRTIYRFIVPEDQKELPAPDEFTPVVLDDDSNIFIDPGTGFYVYTAPDQLTDPIPYTVPDISSVPSPAQDALDGSAAECNSCAGVRSSCVGGTQDFPGGYAHPTFLYNDDKNKEKNKDNTPTPLTPHHDFPSTATSSTLGEERSFSSPTSSFEASLPSPTAPSDAEGGFVNRSPSDPPLSAVEEDFNAVWELYPLKQGRTPALSRWKYLSKRKALPTLSIILNSLKAHVANDSRWKRGMLPSLERWLREERWNDQPFEAPAASIVQQKLESKQTLEVRALQQLGKIRQAISGKKISINDPVTNDILDTHGGLFRLSQMPEKNIPFILNSFVREYTALSMGGMKKNMEVACV